LKKAFPVPSEKTAVADVGGSWLRLCVLAEGKKVFWKRRAPPLHQLPKILHAYWKRINYGRGDRLVVGSKGIWSNQERINLKGRLAPLARTVIPLSDVELALYTAFPHIPRGPRAILIAGTGSIAVGISPQGRLVRAGGLGPEKGDEGSGWWIGNEFVRRSSAQKKSFQNRQRTFSNIRKIAALAKQIMIRSAHDPLCAQIVQEAQSHLAALVDDIVCQLKPKSSLALTWGGSLLSNTTFRRGVFAKIESIHRTPIRFVPPPKNPVETAVRFPACIPTKVLPLPPRSSGSAVRQRTLQHRYRA
jgi:hypothetical protein